jgi:hypothetical protein
VEMPNTSRRIGSPKQRIRSWRQNRALLQGNGPARAGKGGNTKTGSPSAMPDGSGDSSARIDSVTYPAAGDRSALDGTDSADGNGRGTTRRDAGKPSSTRRSRAREEHV